MSDIPIDFAILPTNTDELAIANIQNNVRLLNALWSSADDTIDVTHGAFASLIVHPAATLLEGGKQAFALARRSSSFTALAQDNADAASIQMLDELAKSYCVQRRVGKRATGIVRVVYSASVQTVISSGTVFEARGFRFVPIRTVTAVASSDSLLLQTGAVNFRKMPDSSNYVFFDVEVSATTNGSVGNLVKGTELTISNIIPNYCLYAFVLETFTNGEDDESNAELVARMQLGISAKVLSSRTNMRAALLEKFPDIRDSSVIGAGDIEMTRDKRSLIPISTGGFADWYIGTSRQLLTTRYNLKEIRKWSDNADGTVNYWATITNDDIPCLYSIISVEDGETLERYEVTTETREVNVTGGSNAPQIAAWSNSEDGFFSSYQVTNFHFTAPQGRVCNVDFKKLPNYI
jgi:hypothetical protein